MLHRLVVNWVYGGFLAGLLFLLLSPLFVRSWPPVLAATFFCLPAYMLHLGKLDECLGKASVNSQGFG